MSTDSNTIDDILDEADTGPCWCGEPSPHYDEDPWTRTCGGEGYLYCLCGGDLCVCHHHGQEVECGGCEDCDGDDLDFEGGER